MLGKPSLSARLRAARSCEDGSGTALGAAVLFPFLMLVIVALHTISSASRSELSLQAESTRAALAAALCCNDVREAAAEARASLGLRAQYRGTSSVDCIDSPDGATGDTPDRSLVEADVAFSHRFGGTAGDTVFVEPPAGADARRTGLLVAVDSKPGQLGLKPPKPEDYDENDPTHVLSANQDSIATLEAVDDRGYPRWWAVLVYGDRVPANDTEYFESHPDRDETAMGSYLNSLYLNVPLGGQATVTATCQLATTTLGGVFLGSSDGKRRAVGEAVIDPFRQRREMR